MATQPIDDIQADDPAPVDDAGAVNDAAASMSEVEQLAIDMGWTPKDKFTGPEAKWKPAKDFILRGKEISDGLRDTVKDLKRTVDHMASTGAKMTERALKEQVKEIEARFAEAVENKDAPGAAAAAREMKELEAAAAKPSATNPEKDFAARNPWYETNRAAKALAIMTSQEEAQKGSSIEEQLEAAERAVKAEFPHLFNGTATPARKPADVAAPGARTTGMTRAKGPADLPAAAKAGMEQYVAMFARKFPDKKPDEIRAQYAKDYFADQA